MNDSNPCSSLGVMKFQKWELFSGSPGKATFTNGAAMHAGCQRAFEGICGRFDVQVHATDKKRQENTYRKSSI